jgi:hypothetical protein
VADGCRLPSAVCRWSGEVPFPDRRRAGALFRQSAGAAGHAAVRHAAVPELPPMSQAGRPPSWCRREVVAEAAAGACCGLAADRAISRSEPAVVGAVAWDSGSYDRPARYRADGSEIPLRPLRPGSDRQPRRLQERDAGAHGHTGTRARVGRGCMLWHRIPGRHERRTRNTDNEARTTDLMHPWEVAQATAPIGADKQHRSVQVLQPGSPLWDHNAAGPTATHPGEAGWPTGLDLTQ